MKAYGTLLVVLMLVVSCGGAEYEESSEQQLISVVINLHMDPVGVQGTQEEREEKYAEHRDAFLWLQALAAEKGFKITAEATGLYAEFAVRNEHLRDFADFFSGGFHMLGTHLHSHYKTEEDRQEWYHWTLDRQHRPSLAPKVFTDQLEYVNQIFTASGYVATDNHLLHASHTHSEDMAATLGAKTPNDNAYPNVFDIIQGQRGLYHPYRSDPNTTVTTGLEDLDQPFVAVPFAAGIFGEDKEHGPEGMLYGTLPYVQRDFILEYLEWSVHDRRGFTALPWVFGFGIHPSNLVSGSLGTDGVERRMTLTQFYEWMNENFIGVVAEYATLGEVAECYLEWENANPRTTVYIDQDTLSDGIQPKRFTQALADPLTEHLFRFQGMNCVTDAELFDFVNDHEDRALLILPSGVPQVNLTYYFSGSVVVVDLLGESSIVPVEEVILSSDPILIATPGFDNR